jgi:hypothetical protein
MAGVLPFLAQGDVRLPVATFMNKLNALDAGDAFDTEIARAMIRSKELVPVVPAGNSCAVATPEVIKEKCTAVDSHFLASGTLSQLNLQENAINSLDVGTIKMVIEQSVSIVRLKDLIGPITINMDTWAGGAAIDLVRADKDGYVHALCLMLLWSDDGDAETKTALTTLCTDLTFKFEKMGQGVGHFLNACVWVVAILDRLGTKPMIAVAIWDRRAMSRCVLFV